MTDATEARVELTWIEGQRYGGVDSAGGSVTLASGEEAGLRPASALLLALAACAAHDVVEVIRKQRGVLRRLAVAVDGERAEKPPRAFRRIHLHFEAAADGISEGQLHRAADLALNKYCTVRASLAPEIAVTFDVALSGEARRGAAPPKE